MHNPLRTIKGIMLFPDEFFKIKTTLLHAFLFYIFITGILFIIEVAVLYFGYIPGNFYGIMFLFSELTPEKIILIPLYMFEIGIATLFLYSGVAKLTAKIFRERIKYETAVKAIAFGATPAVLFAWIPVLNILFAIWSWYLFIRAFKIIEKIKAEKAFYISIPVFIIIGILSSFFTYILVSAI